MVTHVWLQNKLPLIPSQVRIVFLHKHINHINSKLFTSERDLQRIQDMLQAHTEAMKH